VPFVSIDGVAGITSRRASPKRSPPRSPACSTASNCAPNTVQAGARRVRDEFSLETMTARTLDLYHDILPELASASSDAPSKMLAL
jgi:hypothetical protein